MTKNVQHPRRPASPPLPDLTSLGYNDSEIQIITDLYKNGGAAGRHAALYIAMQNVRLYSSSYMYSGNGAQWTTNGDIVINSNLYGDIKDLSPSDSQYAIVASLVAHEANHLERGAIFARSVYGEHEAWKVGYSVGKSMGLKEPAYGSAESLILREPLSLDEDDLKEIQLLMINAYPSYPIWAYPLNPSSPYSAFMDFLSPAVTGAQVVYGWYQGK